MIIVVRTVTWVITGPGYCKATMGNNSSVYREAHSELERHDIRTELKGQRLFPPVCCPLLRDRHHDAAYDNYRTPLFHPADIAADTGKRWTGPDNAEDDHRSTPGDGSAVACQEIDTLTPDGTVHTSIGFGWQCLLQQARDFSSTLSDDLAALKEMKPALEKMEIRSMSQQFRPTELPASFRAGSHSSSTASSAGDDCGSVQTWSESSSPFSSIVPVGVRCAAVEIARERKRLQNHRAPSLSPKKEPSKSCKNPALQLSAVDCPATPHLEGVDGLRKDLAKLKQELAHLIEDIAKAEAR